MRNKQTDLNDHLFMQLERLNDESINDELLDIEIGRSKAISSIAKEIIANGRLAIDAQTMMSEGALNKLPKIIPRFLGVEDATQIHN